MSSSCTLRSTAVSGAVGHHKNFSLSSFPSGRPIGPMGEILPQISMKEEDCGGMLLDQDGTQKELL